MERLPEFVPLLDCLSGQPCQGRVVPLTRQLAKRQIDARWWALKGVSAALRRGEDDHHWNWAKLIGHHRQNLAWELRGDLAPGWLESEGLH